MPYVLRKKVLMYEATICSNLLPGIYRYMYLSICRRQVARLLQVAVEYIHEWLCYNRLLPTTCCPAVLCWQRCVWPMYMYMCCKVVIAQWSERRQLRSDALGSILSALPKHFFSQFVSMPIYPPVALPTTSGHVVQYTCKCIYMHVCWQSCEHFTQL